MNSKYAPLESHLAGSGQVTVPMTFGEIEQVIGTPLPPAALQHRAMWSNNPSNWVMTKAWLAAGYETVQVNMEHRKLVFRKTVRDTASPEGGDRSSAPERSGSFATIFGQLRDTVTIAPGTDLTKPIDEDWNAGR